jgi:lysophospholipase L1-like esterase
LDQAEAWPQLLQSKLNQVDQDSRSWVGNVGKAGRNSREHIVQMKHLLPQHDNLDAVLLLIGVNDFVLRLELGDAYTPDYLASPGMNQKLIRRAFDVYPKQDPNLVPYYQQTATATMIDKIQQARQPVQAQEIEIQDENGDNVIRQRQQRQNGTIREELPDLSASLAEYSDNVNTLIDLAEANNVRIILVTQPSIWNDGLTQAEQELLWLGWGPDKQFYYSVEALAEGMAAYNQKLLEVCETRQVECIDLAAMLPKDSSVFYDDVHFNENGAEQVAATVANYLLDHSSLTSSR